jgi:Gluconate 2-dehydrogenase subunit 3
MNRRDLIRTSLFGALGLTSASPPALPREFSADYDASKELARPDWKPVFVDEHQNQTLIALSELIIPTTDTPGAKDALVNRFLDLLMSVESTETQRAFIAALAYIDGTCMQTYKAAFIYLPQQQQIAFLNLIAYPHSHKTWGEAGEDFPGYTHFQKLKDWVVGAYYNSPIGLKELGWDGSFPHGVFSGCEHAGNDHQEHKQSQ